LNVAFWLISDIQTCQPERPLSARFQTSLVNAIFESTERNLLEGVPYSGSQTKIALYESLPGLRRPSRLRHTPRRTSYKGPRSNSIPPAR
jgi:hypothetical protein